MRWQRIGQVLLAAGGAGCAGLVAYQFHTRHAPAFVRPDVKHDPAATVEGGKGETLEWGRGGREDWHISFSAMTGYADGRTVFQGSRFRSAHGDRQFDITADRAETQGKGVRGEGPATIALTGHVRIVTSDHWEIQSDTASYEDATGVLTMPGLVTFARDRLTGEGQGATYDRFNDILTFLEQAHVRQAPDASGGNVLDARASKITLVRPQKTAWLEGATRLVRDKEVLSADAQTILFTDDEKGLKHVELDGHAHVVPQPGATAAPPDMHADTIDMTVHPDGRTLQHAALRGGSGLILAGTTGAKTIAAQAIDLTLAPDGQTVTRLDADGGVTVQLPPTADTPTARTITAPILVATGTDAGGLQTALFSGNAKYVEHGEPAAAGQPPTDRTATSQSLSLKLNGDLGAVDQAEFRQTVSFHDGDVQATSQHATYVETKSLLTLDRPGTADQPVVVNGNVTVHGDEMRVNTDSHDVMATGRVQTVSRPSTTQSTSTSSPGLFDSTQPVYGKGDELLYENQAQRATYKGSETDLARVWQNQNQNTVRAVTVVVEQTTNNLTASGMVSTVFVPDPKPGAAPSAGPPDIYRTKAHDLVYTDSTRLAHYVGDTEPAQLTTANGTTTAHVIDVVLAAESRTVKTTVADGDVHLTGDAGREGLGTHVTYDSATDMYHLTGVPAQAVLPQSKGDTAPNTQCTLYTGKDLTFNGNGFAEARGGPDKVTSMALACGTPIKPIIK